ncbi:(2Fe-2S)-binding protein [Paenibacillus sp. HB172176]|uniref:(2Fe-2S)-binding protein n=1 Tax=Paenibacillus sp. HB172176 TaxID=2493690 RepID=UPI00143A5D90|nr:(2Fe-2S)-binding protein [Paenibacillus sp. HB172176]
MSADLEWAGLDADFMDQYFQLCFKEPEGSVYSAPASQLLEGGGMKSFLERYAPEMKALDRQAAAAYLAKWLGGPAIAQQYLMAYQGRAMRLAHGNIRFHLVLDGGHARILFEAEEAEWTMAPESKAERANWIREELAALHGGFVRPLLERIAEAGGMRLAYLWGLMPTRLNYLMEQIPKAAPGVPDIDAEIRLLEDYRLLKEELEPAVFGLKRNPLQVKIRWVEHYKDSEERMRMKNVCCMYYRTEGGSYCYTCPRMTAEEREERLRMLRQ